MSHNSSETLVAFPDRLARMLPLPVEQVWMDLTAEQQRQVLLNLVQICRSLLKGSSHSRAENEVQHEH